MFQELSGGGCGKHLPAACQECLPLGLAGPAPVLSLAANVVIKSEARDAREGHRGQEARWMGSGKRSKRATLSGHRPAAGALRPPPRRLAHRETLGASRKASLPDPKGSGCVGQACLRPACSYGRKTALTSPRPGFLASVSYQ